MRTLIVPAAGASTRFRGVRPKPYLTMPSGLLMLEASIAGLHPDDFEQTLVVVLKQHADEFLGSNGISKVVKRMHSLGHNAQFIVLDEPTASSAATVAKACEMAALSGPIYIKDSDNMFSVRWTGGNEVAYVDLQSHRGSVEVWNKSFVQLDANLHINSITEKVVSSNTFCTGGYGFESAKSFLSHFESASDVLPETEVFVSHVVMAAIYEGNKYLGVKAEDIHSWGTLNEFLDYQESFTTLFCDLDGVLLQNSGECSVTGWTVNPIEENIKALLELQQEGRLHLVITTSRSTEACDSVKRYFSEIGLVVSGWVCDLPHQKRVLVNDYASSLPFPSASAISIARDSRDLGGLLHRVARA